MVIADLHIHSHYSRATSKDCTPEALEFTAARKGIGILGSGDFTHPAWRQELKEKLVMTEEGFYCLKEEFRRRGKGAGSGAVPRFVISGEISSIYKKNGRVRKVHSLILLPSLEAAERLSTKLEEIGNLHSDGRPILGLDCRDLLEITLSVCPDAVYIPAHIWTPHFSLFGAFSGFDTMEECYEDMTPYIRALETGLSSDPAMNWQLSALDPYFLISNSDAHSPAKLGREANLLEIEPSYPALREALQNGNGLLGTIEFFPEEGKYHFDGHRNCGICLNPEESEKYSGKCPVCGKKLTIGVSHRVKQLADQMAGRVPAGAKPYESLVPLKEVIASCIGCPAESVRVDRQYEVMLERLGTEFDILRKVSAEEIRTAVGERIAEGILRLREGRVLRMPGYDGAYGTIRLFSPEEENEMEGQLNLFFVIGQKEEVSAALEESSPTLEESSAVLEESQSQEFLSANKKEEQGSGEAELVSKQPERLNPGQQAAAGFCGRAAAIIAGPGTGKTKTLIAHLTSLLKDRGIPPEKITAVTFTNQAARELKERLFAAVGEELGKQVAAGTFHSLCFQLLTEQGRNFHLMQESECLELAERVLAEAGAGEGAGSRRRGEPSAKLLLEQVSRHKMGLPLRSGAVLEERIRQYEEALEAEQALDFDSLLTEALAWYQTSEPDQRFSYLLVDEFQDINEIQYQLLKAWNKNGEELFAIGDPDQAIYGFRGAVPECFAKLKGDFPETETISLIENYRSTPQILSAAEAVLSTSDGNRKKLQPVNSSGFPVRLVNAESGMEEGIFIAKEINRLVGGIDMLDSQEQNGAVKHGEREAVSFADLAVLYRTRRQGKLLEYCLQKEGIPYVVSGREDFLAEPEIRGTVDFFCSLFQPDDVRLAENCKRLLWGNRQDGEEAYAAAAGRWKPLLQENSPRKLLELWGEEQSWEKEAKMQKLTAMAGCYDTMEEFLSTLIFGVESDVKRSGRKVYTSDAVHLMTLHGSKGLEFPVVFLCGVNQGLIPLLNTAGTDLEEERRLFYVGMTRAKEELILISGEKPSEFLKPIQETRNISREPEGAMERAEDWIQEERGNQKRQKKEKKKEESGTQLTLFDFLE